VSKCADLEKLIDAAVERFGRLDIMVNNAGIETRISILDTSEAQYDKVMAINLKSAFFGTQIAAKQMIKQGGGGRIINITLQYMRTGRCPAKRRTASPKAACACSYQQLGQPERWSRS